MGSEVLNRLREVTQNTIDSFYGRLVSEVTPDVIRVACMEKYSKLLLPENVSCQASISANRIRVEVGYGAVTFFVP